MPEKLITSLLIGGFILGLCGSVYAAKPQDVIMMINGYPSGLHFNPNGYDKGGDYNCSHAVGGKGQSKSTDISRFFTYTDRALGETFDSNLDGVIDINDIPLGDYDNDGGVLTPPNHDFNNDGTEDADDVDAWLTSKKKISTRHSDSEWTLHVADLVFADQGLVIDGTKLSQTRFFSVLILEPIMIPKEVRCPENISTV